MCLPLKIFQYIGRNQNFRKIIWFLITWLFCHRPSTHPVFKFFSHPFETSGLQPKNHTYQHYNTNNNFFNIPILIPWPPNHLDGNRCELSLSPGWRTRTARKEQETYFIIIVIIINKIIIIIVIITKLVIIIILIMTFFPLPAPFSSHEDIEFNRYHNRHHHQHNTNTNTNTNNDINSIASTIFITWNNIIIKI